MVCRKKISDSKRNAHEDNESDLDTVHVTGENDLFIDSIDFDKNKSQAFAKVALGPKEHIISMKIDSGSQVNVIPKSIYHSLGINGPLQNTNKRLTAYDGTSLKVDGYVRLKCTYNDKSNIADFYIVDTNSSPILGLDACLSLDLIKLVLSVGSGDQPTTQLTKESVLAKYADVFDGIGQLPGECEIYLKPNATRVVHPHDAYL